MSTLIGREESLGLHRYRAGLITKTRLKQWCEDINRGQSDAIYDFVFVDQEGFKKYCPKSFANFVTNFHQDKDD